MVRDLDNGEFRVEPPKQVLTAISIIEGNNKEAFLAGGCVRDSLMGLRPYDWDITTNASPQEVLSYFDEYTTIPTGLKHGTVTVVINELPIEITTYRLDGAYTDHRRPDTVTYTSLLREDLARRDFTVNAMAWNPRSGVVDCFSGMIDLKNKVLTCVGDPERRFGEDALRILRGARFASTLGFTIESGTREAMLRNVASLSYVSPERIFAELRKAILGDSFADVFTDMPELMLQVLPELRPMLSMNISGEEQAEDLYSNSLSAVRLAPKDILVRLALLLREAGKPEVLALTEDGVASFIGHEEAGARIAREAMSRLRADNNTRDGVSELIALHNADIGPDERNVKRWLRRVGPDTLRRLLDVQEAIAATSRADISGEKKERVIATRSVMDKVLAEGQCYTLPGLAINGTDLMTLGVERGPEIGRLLNALLDRVVDGDLPNNKSALLDEAWKLIGD
jgi:tRNA nucleotidyltransferase (CCA-adding enzyme)